MQPLANACNLHDSVSKMTCFLLFDKLCDYTVQNFVVGSSNSDDGTYIENTSWKVLAYGIYTRVVFVSEIERVSAANE